MTRDAHAKAHGCVKAEFKVNSDLSRAGGSSGVFIPNATYQTWIRYSNGSGKSQDDREGHGRGMAIKLMGVAGPKLLPAESTAQTQDFLMINHPRFFVRNAKDYVHFQNVVFNHGNPARFFLPSWEDFTGRASEARVAFEITQRNVLNPLKTQYWSMVPILYGSRAVKYSAKPCSNLGSTDIVESPHRLRENLNRSLAQSEACFDFKLQFQTNPQTMPVEDAVVEWSESESPFIDVAKVKIARNQDIDSVQARDFCENLSMTPWHGLTNHRPLGGINRVRKAVYETISELRHRTNGRLRIEPQE